MRGQSGHRRSIGRPASEGARNDPRYRLPDVRHLVPDPRAVGGRAGGRELGVRYVLERSIQRSGNRVRVNAQLIDAETDAHLWEERFVGDTSDLFALQDEITSRIAISLNLELVAAADPASVEAQSRLARALAVRVLNDMGGSAAADLARAEALVEQALAVSPRGYLPHSARAELLRAQGRFR